MSIRKRMSKKAKNGYVYEVYFTYKENGITQRYSKSGFSTKKEAQEHETLMKAELKESGKIQKEVKKTFREVYDEFLKNDCGKYHYDTFFMLKKAHKYFDKELGKIQIGYIDYNILQTYFNSRSNQGLATNKNIKKAIKLTLDYAYKVGYIKSNPISLINVQGVHNENIHKNDIITYDQLMNIVDILNKENNFKYQSYSTALLIGYYTGMRISEVLALEKSDFDLKNGYIDVNKKLIYKGLKVKDYYSTHIMKSKKSKSIIPLAEPLKEYLIEWFETNPYERVICDIDGYYIDQCYMRNVINKISQPLGVNFHFHMLRHTFATNLVTNNVDLKTAQELMRHTNIDTTISIYTHINDDHKKNVLNSVFNTKCVKNMSKDLNVN